MASRFWVGGSGNWDATDTTHWAATSGGAGGASVPTSADTVTFDTASASANYTVTYSAAATVTTIAFANPTGGTLSFNFGSNLTATGAVTFGSGTLNLNNNTLNCLTFTSTASTNRTIAFGTSGAINMTSTATSTVLGLGNGTNFTVTGTSAFNLSGAAASGIVRTITTGTGWIESNAINIYVTGGASGNIVRPTTPFIVKTFSFAGATSSIMDLNTNVVVSTIYGSFIMPSTQFGTAVNTSVSVTFASTQTGNQIKSNNLVNQSSTGGLMATVNFNGVGGEWIIQDTFTQNGSFQTLGNFALTNGTLNLNNNAVLIQTFQSTNANVRSINFGTSGYLSLYRGTSAATIWDTSTSTNLTNIGTPKVVINLFSGSIVTLNTGTLTNNGFNFFPVNTLTGGTQTFAFVGNINSLNASGLTYATNWASISNVNIYGSITLNNFVTASTATTTMNFKSTKTGNTITTGTSTLTNVTTMVFDGVGGEWILQDNYTSTNATNVTLTNGTLNLNNKSMPIRTFSSSNSNARSVNFGTSGTLDIYSSSGVVWNTDTSTNLTYQGVPKVTIHMFSTTTATMNAGSITSNPMNLYVIPNTPGTGAALILNGNIGTFDTTAMANTITYSSTAGMRIYRNLNLNSFATFAASQTINFLATGPGFTINPNGATMTNVTAINFSGTGGWTFTSAMTATNAVITQTAGTVNTGGYSISALSYNITGNGAVALNLGASTMTLNGAIPWNITGTNITFTPATSTITCTNSAPTFNGNGLTYNNVTFSNSAATTIAINGQNTYNTLSIPTPTTVGYLPIVFGANQTATGSVTITGTTVGNFRLWFRSSVSDTVRTITAASVTNLNDVDFRDISITGASAPWTGNRLGDAGNNSGITFSTSKTVYWNNSSAGNWSGNFWTNSSGGTVNAIYFPLPQDNTIINSTAAITIDFPYTIGTTSIISTSFRITSTAYFTGDVLVSTTSSSGDIRTTGTAYFYNRQGITQTFTVRTYSTGSTFQWNGPIVIDTTGTVQMSNMSYGNYTTPNKQFSCQTGAYISHIRGSLLLNDTIMTIPYYDSSFGGNTRLLNLGTATTTFNYGTDTTKGFVTQMSGFTMVPNTSTVIFSGTMFGIISDGNLSFNNLSITVFAAANTKLIASKSYANNESVLSSISISVNNLTLSNQLTGFTNSWLQLSGISNINISGLMSLPSANGVTQRVTIASLDLMTNISAGSINAISDVDFSGITASGPAIPWTGTRLGDAGRNSNITFDAPKTLYWASGTGTFNWYSLGWTTTLGGSQSSIIPLAHDIVILNDTQPAGSITFNILNNFALPSIDCSSRTLSTTMSTTGNMLYAGYMTFYSGLSWSGSGNLYFTGNSTKAINSAGKSITQAVRIAAGGSIQLAAALTVTNASGVIHSAGNLDLNNFTLTTPIMALSTPVTKSISFGTSGIIAVTGNNNTVLSIPQSVNNSITPSGTSAINLTYTGATGTRTIDTSGISSDNSAISINVTAGTDILSIGTTATNSGVKNLNTQGFSGTWVHQSPVNLYGNLTIGTGVATIQDVSMNYVSSGTGTITTNGKVIRGKLVVNSNGGSLTQQDALTLTQFTGGAISYLQVLQGTYAANGFSTTIDRLSSIGSLTRTISMGSGTWTLTAVDDPSMSTWEVSSSNSTVASATSTIVLSGAGTKTFKGGSKTYNNLTLSGTAGLTNITNITGANIFNTISNTVQPLAVTFESNASQSFTNFNINGTSGNLVNLSSNTSLQAVLYKASAWNVGTNSVNGGGNSGLNFVSGTNDYINFTNISATNTTPRPPAIYFTGGASLSGGYSITF